MAKMGHGHGHGGHHQGHHGHQGHGHHGHQGHAIVVVPGKKARGGKVKDGVREESRGMSPRPMEDERTREMEEREERGEKRGGKVSGHHAKARHDRRARGGRMTPKSPFSGADGPNPSYARSHPTTKFEGEGEHPRP